MDADVRLAIWIGAVLTVLVLVFGAGAWYGSRDRTCVTADANGATVVYCSSGQPTGQFEK